MSDLIAAFRKYFEVVPASTDDLKNRFFHLRYQVYSQELQLPGFESSHYPDRREIDKYDQRSVYSLLRHRQSGNIVGGIRLILCDHDDPSQLFPVEEHAGNYFDSRLIDLTQLPRRTTVEISRLVVARNFRCRGKEVFYAHGMDDSSFDERRRESLHAPERRRQFPHPVLGLLVALVQMSVEYGTTHWYAIMEPALNRILRRFSFDLRPIGPAVDYYGVRQPYLDSMDDVLTRVFQENPDIWELVTERGKFYPAPKEKTARRPGTRT